ncbi:MAG: radical SAM protein [Candidatus Thorarchaeota archaeon]|nr:MAG: radical SAM protein [Candidatus Thorarchaeota archaeon]
MRYECVKAKSLLSKTAEAESWFHYNRHMNSYRGCEHACVYCDGMAEGYHVDNFLTHIRVKENAPEILRKELRKAGHTSQTQLETETLWAFLDEDDAKRLAQKVPRKEVIAVSGGVSDAYQPAEEKYQITRRVLETLLDFGLPVYIMTKSDLVLRDLDLLKEIHEKAFANVVFTITLYDEEEQGIFEPKSSTRSERFEALREIRKAGLFGGVMATPIIPGIGDNIDNMKGLAEEAKRARAEFILWGEMTLKPGRQKDYFLNVIKRRYPDKLELIQRIYQDDHPYGHPIYEHLPVRVMTRGHGICRRVGISDRSVRHKTPHEHEVNNKVLGVVLDIIFRRRYNLSKSWSGTKPFIDLAVGLERGVENLEELRKKGQLAERLHLKQYIVEIVEEIMDRGTCGVLEDLESELDEISSVVMD